MSTVFKSPVYYRETIFSQGERIEQELEDARLHHALSIGRQSLRRLKDKRFGGHGLDALTTKTILLGDLKLDGVAPEYIPAIAELVVERYLSSN